jgi:hypothetical protein
MLVDMFPLYECDAVTELLSVALIVKVYAPGVEGVPEMTPVETFKLNPAGRDPAVIENATGAVPPVVWTV